MMRVMMPTYDFICDSCGDIVTQSFAYDVEPKINCGHCACPMRKVFSAPAVHFKGEGWGGKG
jgi:putative FmdB family regulatory protein